jgi:hypothetical protein
LRNRSVGRDTHVASRINPACFLVVVNFIGAQHDRTLTTAHEIIVTRAARKRARDDRDFDIPS